MKALVLEKDKKKWEAEYGALEEKRKNVNGQCSHISLDKVALFLFSIP